MPDEPVDNEPKTFTQEEVDRMVGRARGEAKRSAATEEVLRRPVSVGSSPSRRYLFVTNYHLPP